MLVCSAYVTRDRILLIELQLHLIEEYNKMMSIFHEKSDINVVETETLDSKFQSVMQLFNTAVAEA